MLLLLGSLFHTRASGVPCEAAFFPGHWAARGSVGVTGLRQSPPPGFLWQPDCNAANGQSPPPVGDRVGADALRALRGSLVMFLGDSILRQVFHALVMGSVRQLPVLVDPVYGFASYHASAPEGGEFCTASNASDAFYAVGKFSGKAARDGVTDDFVRGITPPGWSAATGVELAFSFQQSCREQTAALRKLKVIASTGSTHAPFLLLSNLALKASLFHALSRDGNNPSVSYCQGAKEAFGGGRRIIIVLGVGATTTLGGESAAHCLAEALPAVLRSLSLRWARRDDRPAHERHAVVVMTQPVKRTRLRGVPPDRHALVTTALAALVARVNTGSGATAHVPTDDGDGAAGQEGHVQHLAAHVLDFARLVDGPTADEAPPDAAWPLLEDDLHYGCMVWALRFTHGRTHELLSRSGVVTCAFQVGLGGPGPNGVSLGLLQRHRVCCCLSSGHALGERDR